MCVKCDQGRSSSPQGETETSIRHCVVITTENCQRGHTDGKLANFMEKNKCDSLSGGSIKMNQNKGMTFFYYQGCLY